MTSIWFSLVQLDAYRWAFVILMLVSASLIALARAAPYLGRLSFSQAKTALRLPAFLVYLFIVYLLSFPDIAEDLLSPRGFHATTQLYFWGSLVAALAIWAWVAIRVPGFVVNDIGVLLACVLAVLISFSGLAVGEWGVAILFNALVIFHSINLILEGSRSHRVAPVIGGCLLFSLLAMSRYVDLFDSLIARAVVFLVVGASVFAAGNFYAREKRRLVGVT